MSDDRAYYSRRVEEELAAAECAGNPGTASIHREMAKRYRELLSREIGVMNGDADLALPGGGSLAATGALHA